MCDLEDELLHAAQAFCAWRDHVMRDAARSGFTCAEVLGFIQETRAEKAFPRISHHLLAHVVEGLAASLSQNGLLECVSPGVYCVSEHALAHLAREPTYLGNEPSLPGTVEFAFQRKDS